MHLDPLRPSEPDPHIIDSDRIEALEVDNSENSVRTIIRLIDVEALGSFEREELDKLRRAFGRERARFFQILRMREHRRNCYGTGYRRIRDAIVKEDRMARNMGVDVQAKHPGLQARHWKMALQSAAIVVSNYWRLAQANARSMIFAKEWTKDLNDVEHFYIQMMLSKLRPEFFELLDGKNPHFERFRMEEIRDLPKLCLRIRRTVRRALGSFPSPGRSVNVWFDQSCYKVQNENGVECVYLTSMTKGKRIRVELKGIGKVGSVIHLLFRDDGKLELHVMEPLKKKPLLNVPVIPEEKYYSRAFDMGLTEVFTDDEGNHYGKNLGELLSQFAETLNRKLTARNRLQSLARNTTSKRKRRNILCFNLGSDRFDALKARMKAQIRCCINHALNEMFKKAPADAYIVEELSANFLQDLKLPKRVKRLLSGWVRGIIGERLAFKAAERQVKLVKVAAGYSSQTCCQCLFTCRENRKGDKFKCMQCGTVYQSDHVGALNLLFRVGRGTWPRKMTKEKAWELSRREYEECCRLRGVEPLDDPHKAQKKVKKTAVAK